MEASESSRDLTSGGWPGSRGRANETQNATRG